MTSEEGGGKLHIDTDWKEEAAREKQRLAEQERKDKSAESGGGADSAATFVELINLIALQAAVALGGMQGPGGEPIPANPHAARHFIDLLEVLQKKTDGNLTDDERRVLEAVLYELRMQFVQSSGRPPTPTGPEPKGP